MKKYIALLQIFISLFVFRALYAADDVPVSEYLLFNYDSNSEASGGTIASMSPGSLSFINTPSSNFSVLSGRLDFSWLSAYDGMYGGAGALMIPSGYGNFAAAFSYNNLGSSDRTLMGFYLNYVYPFSADVPVYSDMGGVGATAKAYRFEISGQSQTSFVFDVGGHYNLKNILPGLWAFAALKNLGNDVELSGYGNIELPGSFTLALRYNLPFASKPAFTADAIKFFSDHAGYALGFEIIPAYPVTLKMGWRDYGDYINWGPTIGLFLNFDSFNAGYSFAAKFGDYAPKHSVNFGFMFGRISNENKAYDYYLGYNFNMAEEAYKRKDYISARQQLEEILAVYRDHQPSKELLKQLVYDLDLYDRNIELQINKWLRRADLALHQNNLIKARNYYYRVLGVDPENADAESGLAQVNAKLYKVEIQENRKKYEKEIIALWNEGMDYYNSGQFIFAKEKFTRILDIDPENAGALKYLSVIQTQVSKVTDLQADKMFMQGMEYYNMADYERAAQYFNAVYATDSKRTDAKEYYELSKKALNLSVMEMSSKTAKERQGKDRLSDKDDSFLSSNQKLQKEMETHFSQAVDLFNAGKYEDALKTFVALREKGLKNNYYDLNRQIREYTAKSRNAISENYFKDAVAFIKIDKQEEAVEKLKKALEYNKEYTAAEREYERLLVVLAKKYYDLGIKSYSSGQKSKAVAYLEKSLEYEPKKIESRKALDRIKALGD